MNLFEKIVCFGGGLSQENRAKPGESSLLVKMIYLQSVTHFNTFSTKIQSQDRIVKMFKIFLCHFSSWSLILPHHSKSLNHKKK